MMYKAALFDLDGVIIDSERLYTVFWNDIEKVYPTGIPDFAVAIKGTTLPEILGNYATEEVRADITRRLNEFQDSMRFPLIDGAVEFLEWLRANGIPRALVTSSDARKMECLKAQLPDLLNLFDVVIDASKVTRSKPDPQGYLLAAEALGVDAQQCVVFEDSINGLKAGRASGARVVALATTYPAARLEPLADEVVEGWSQFSWR
ncbi:MAG: HAD family phosphatase [Muribaculaceae bacterium]|nr:HAD family phosphatase [Muribaculaceae bacterium]